MHLAAAFGSLVGAAGILAWRVRETRRAVTAASILIPPLGMSTGMLMFVLPRVRITWPVTLEFVPDFRLAWPVALGSFLAGVLLFSYPLIHTSKLEVDGDAVMLRRSKAFLWILLGLIAVRLALRTYVERYVSPMQTASMFYLIAFGMLVPWRIAMFLRYRALRAKGHAPSRGEVELAG